MTGAIRFVARGIVQRKNELLVSEERSPETGKLFYRLLGGGVEFGEHSRDTVVREFDEELGVTFVNPTQVGTFEQVFSFDGETKHEIWRVYEGQIAESWPYDQESFTFVEPEHDAEHLARWMSIERLRDADTTFYPPEVLDVLTT